MSLIISDFKQKDSSELLHIYNQIVKTTSAIYRETPFSDQEWQKWVEARQQQNFPIFIACKADDPSPLGFASYTYFRAAQGYRYTFEHTLHVKEGQRGNGIGTKLMEEIIVRSKQQNAHILIGAIDAQNQGSIRFHERFGFEISAKMAEVAQLHGVWRDLILLQKTL